MPNAFHENRVHGTTAFPLQVYSHHDRDGFYSVSQHWHEELEWIWAETGVLSMTVHGKPCTLQAGEFCFINSGELHEIRSEGASLHHAIVFQAGMLDFALYDSCQHQFIRPVTSGQLTFPTRPDRLAPDTARQILACLRDIVQCYHDKSPSAPLHIKIRILQVLELPYRDTALTEPTASPRAAATLNKLKTVLRYMRANYAQPLTLQQLADLVYLSPAYFCHAFHHATGTSPIAFLNGYRIEQAARMLAETDESISRIAEAVGFDNFSYFIRKFREYKRISPREYRRQIR